MSADKRKQLENFIEQKMLEFFGDPDSGLGLNKSFTTLLRKRLSKKQKLVSNSEVAAKYGIR